MHNLPIVILISGRGSNMQAILEQAAQRRTRRRYPCRDQQPARCRRSADCRSGRHTTAIVDHRDYADREHYDQALKAAIDSYQPALVVLAGFMRILTPAFVRIITGD